MWCQWPRGICFSRLGVLLRARLSIAGDSFFGGLPLAIMVVYRLNKSRQPYRAVGDIIGFGMKVSESSAKGVDSSRQPDGGHGSRNPLRSV